MDANGTKFHLLLGQDDWAECSLVAANRRTPLREVFGLPPAPCDGEDAQGLAWGSQRHELTLRPCLFKFIPSKSDRPPELTDRRGAARDRYGNWYWIAASEREILVNSAGTGVTSHFWSVGDGLECERPTGFGDFQPKTPKSEPTPLQFRALAVTEDHYLVVGVLKPKGLLIFDLHAGGPPRQVLWPEVVEFTPFDMAPRPGGGVWILDRENATYWGLDRSLNIISLSRSEAPPVKDDFQPIDGSGARLTGVRAVPESVWLNASSPVGARDPISIEALPDGTVLILDRNPGQPFSVIYRYDFDQQKGGPLSLEKFNLVAHDFAFLPEHETPEGAVPDRLYVAESRGNQSFAFRLLLRGDQLAVEMIPEYLPMRLFGGKGLVAATGAVYYDFGNGWIPLVEQKRPRYATQATVETPVGEPRHAFDGVEPTCVWHRLMLDACIPPETEVQVWSRAANEERELVRAEWQKEPGLYLRGNGSELPFVERPGGEGKPKADGDGTWELLFQRARGRYLQLKLKLVGNGRASPRLRALRAYYPRFSYLERYLPAVYREDSQSATFLDHFLANIEGFFTATEDKIAAAQVLFDVRSAPRDTLDWLSGWFGIALDPAWDERKKRLFINHAMTFFQYRGTIRGLRMGLRLALDDCVDQSIFSERAAKNSRETGIRIVEKYLTRQTPGVVFGDPTDLSGLRSVSTAGRWRPERGAALLHELYRTALRLPASEMFPIRDPGGGRSAAWQQFARSTLGFVPAGTVDELTLWRNFLASRYVSIDRLNEAHGTNLAGFERVTLPVTLTAGAASQDWRDFTMQSAPSTAGFRRKLWQDFLARRYQRIAALKEAYRTEWPSFASVPMPDTLPGDGAPLRDWYQFEGVVMAMRRTAHRFTVLVPMPKKYALSAAEHVRRRELAKRIVDLEKPAHTIFDVRFYWAMFLVGQARLGEDTLLDIGSRAPQLMSPMVLGQGYLSETFIAPSHPQNVSDRQILGRDRLKRQTKPLVGEQHHE